MTEMSFLGELSI